MWPDLPLFLQLLQDEIDSRSRIVQPVRMVFQTRFDDHMNLSTELLVTLFQDHRVFGVGDNFVGITTNVQ